MLQTTLVEHFGFATFCGGTTKCHTKTLFRKDRAMASTNLRWIQCIIENSGFSGERRFEVNLHDGGRAVGTASINYLRASNNAPLDEDVPPYGESAAGWVRCRVIREDQGGVLVEFPSADVFHVPADALAES
jgi:hypothetical protein